MKEFLIEKRLAQGLSRKGMAERCGCSERLLEIVELEAPGLTAPGIALRIAGEYGLDVNEYNRLVDERYHAEVIPSIEDVRRMYEYDSMDDF